MNEDDLRELFREMRDEPLPADSLARVRQSVAERTAGKRRGWLWWRLGALAAAAGFVFGVLLLRSSKVEPLPSIPLAAHYHAPEVRVVHPPAPAPKPVVARKPRVARKLPTAQQDLVIRIETPDPDVVLYFVAEGSGE